MGHVCGPVENKKRVHQLSLTNVDVTSRKVHYARDLHPSVVMTHLYLTSQLSLFVANVVNFAAFN